MQVNLSCWMTGDLRSKEAPRPGAGAVVVVFQEERDRGAGPDCAFRRYLTNTLPSYLPRPPAGAVVAIVPERRIQDAGPDYILRRRHPMHRTWWLSPGGGAGEGTPSPSKRTMPAFPQDPRAGAGDIVMRAREGRNRGGNPDCAFCRHLMNTPLSSLPHPARRRPCAPPPPP